MKLDNILQIFVVKEKRFFPLFIQSAENICKAAELLLQQTQTEDREERVIFSHRIKEHETAGDQITNQIIDELMDAYVTPFDRDDIHALAEDMDSFLDCIRDASKKIAIYQPKSNSQKLIKIAEYILEDAKLFLEMTRHFETLRKDVRPLGELCDRVKEIEHTVDDLYESYMSNLFEKETDAIELVRKKNILQILEDTSDQGKAVSNTIRSIIVKMG